MYPDLADSHARIRRPRHSDGPPRSSLPLVNVCHICSARPDTRQRPPSHRGARWADCRPGLAPRGSGPSRQEAHWDQGGRWLPALPNGLSMKRHTAPRHAPSQVDMVAAQNTQCFYKWHSWLVEPINRMKIMIKTKGANAAHHGSSKRKMKPLKFED